MMVRKRIVWAAVCICLLVPLAMSATAADVQETGTVAEGVNYTLYADGTLVFEGTGVIPTECEYLLPFSRVHTIVIKDGISGIADDAFGYNGELKSVTIAGSVKRIGKYAFNMHRLEELVLEEGVREIGEAAFAECANLTQVVFPASIQTIEANAFAGATGLEQVVFLGGAVEVGEFAFKVYQVDTPLVAHYPEDGSWGAEDLVFLGRDAIWTPYTLDASGNRVPGANTTFVHKFSKPMSGEFPDGGYWRTDTEGVLYLGGDDRLYPQYAQIKYWDCIKGLVVEPGVEQIEHNFENYEDLIFAELPAGMVRIPMFRGCKSLERVVLGEGLTVLHSSRFENCESLRSINIPESVTQIEYDAFSGCKSLEHIGIPQSVTDIGERAFKNCEKLQQITLPQNLQRIKENTFEGCTGLKTVEIPASVTRIDTSAFYNCTNLSGVKFMGDAPEQIGAYAFALGVRDIKLYYPGDNATWQNGILQTAYGSTSVWTPYTLDAKGNMLADESNALRVPGILDQQVNGTVIRTFYSDGRVVYEGTGAVYDRFGDGLFYDMTSVEICEGITRIDELIIENNKTAVPVTLASSVTEVGAKAFWSSNVCSINLENVTNIGEFAFFNTALQTVAIGDSCTEIPNDAFRDCKQLSSVVVGKNVQIVGSSVFYGCVNLSQITFKEGCGKKFGGRVFCDTKITEIVLPAGETTFEDDEYGASTFVGCNELRKIVLPEGLKEINYRCFISCGKLESVYIPDSVTTIGDEAFTGCKFLKSLRLGSGLEVIGNEAFLDCEALTEINLPAATREIGIHAFHRCKNLEKVTLNEGLQYISDGAFSYTGLTEITIPSTVIDVGYGHEIHEYGAFSSCDKLKEVTFLTTKLTSIPNGCFAATALREVDIPAGVETVCDRAFYMCKDLKRVSFPEGLLHIGELVFECCGIEEVVIPSSVLDIGAGAFYACEKLERVSILSRKLQCIEEGCFAFTGLYEIVIPAGVTAIRKNALYTNNLRTLIFEGVAPIVDPKAYSALEPPFIYYPARKDYADTYDTFFFSMTKCSGSAPYTVDPDGNYVVEVTVDAQDVAAKMDKVRVQFPEGYAAGAYSVSRLGNSSLVGYGSQAFAYVVSNALFGDLPPVVETEVSFDAVKVGDILRLDGDTRAVVVTEKRENSVVVAQGDWKDTAAYSLRTASAEGTVHWGEELTKEQVEAADYCITRYAGKLYTDMSATVCHEPQWPALHENPSEEEVQQLIYSLKSSYPEGFPYSTDIKYETIADMTGVSLYPVGRGCSAFAFRVSDLAFGNVPMREAKDIVFENIMIGDILHYDPDPDDDETHVVVVLEVYKECVVTVEANYGGAMHWGNVFTKKQVESMMGVYTRYPEGTVPGERAEYHAHSWNDNTCDVDKTCTVCGAEEKAGWHAWMEATCQAPMYCYNCGATEGEPLPHNLDEGVVILWPTEELEGQRQHTCLTCQQTVLVDIPRLEHTHAFTATSVVQPTCTAGGYTTYTCRCGESYTADEVPMLPHTWHDATCTAAKTCSACGATEGSALGHSWKNASCTVPKTCSVCGATEGSALGHSWKNASCTVPKTCSVCGDTEGSALGHTWQDATCEKAKTCSVCGAAEGTALGHSWVEATCTKAKTCTVCGVTEGTPIAHSYDKGKCTVCGAVDENYKPAYTLGDVNGDGRINVTDAMVALRYAVKKITKDELNVEAADVNSDGKVNVTDAMQILRFAVKKITEFKPAK